MRTEVSYSFFSEEDYTKIDSLENLKIIVNKHLQKDSIILCSIFNNENKSSHSMFFIKYKEEIYCVQKVGNQGPFSIVTLDYFFNNYPFGGIYYGYGYGNNFAFRNYESIISEPESYKITVGAYGA